MLPRSEYRPRHSRSYKRDSNPVILRWIAGFFHSTGFCIFHSVPSDSDELRQTQLTVIRWALLFTDKVQDKPVAGPVRCRSPPSDFDLPINPLKIEIGGLP